MIKEPKKKKKNAPKEYRVLSLSTEDAQGKMDAISSILNLSAIDTQFLKYLQKRSLKFFSCDSILKEEILFYLRITSQMFRETNHFRMSARNGDADIQNRLVDRGGEEGGTN